MMSWGLNPDTITGRINAIALELLKQQPEGIRYSELLVLIAAADPTFHPKTVNGCVWLLAEHFPDLVEKPEKGLFRYKHSGTSV